MKIYSSLIIEKLKNHFLKTESTLLSLSYKKFTDIKRFNLSLNTIPKISEKNYFIFGIK